MKEYEKRNKRIIFYDNLNYMVWMLIVLGVCIALILQVETIWYKFGSFMEKWGAMIIIGALLILVGFTFYLMFSVIIAIDSLIYAKEKREEFRIEKERQTKRK
jgi:membrane protein implicated in regulation of membrane protease activity